MKQALGLVILILLCYGGVLVAPDQEFVYDDVRFIAKNDAVRKPGNPIRFFTDPKTVDPGAWEGIYRPLRTLDFAIDWAIAGEDPPTAGVARWFRLRNILYHALSAFLLLLLFRRWGVPDPGPFLAAAVFALHPVQVEAVAFITSRGDCLFMVFLLAALLSHSKSRGMDRWFGLAAALLLLSVFSKEAAVVFPGLAVLGDFFFRDDRRPRVTFRRWRHYLAYLGIALAYVAVFLLSHAEHGGKIAHTDRWWGGSWFGTLLTMSRGFVYYARLVLFPVDMALDFYLGPVSGLDLLTVLCLLLFLASLGLAIHRAFHGGGTGPFAILWAFAAIIPVSNLIVLIALPTAERFLYLPMVGISLWAGTLLARVARIRPAGVWVVGLLLACLFGVSFERARTWRNENTMWSTVVSRFQSPRAECWRADRTRVEAEKILEKSDALEEVGRFSEAARAGEKAHELLRDSVRRYDRSIRIWRSLGIGAVQGVVLTTKTSRAIAIAELGRPQEAIEIVDSVLRRWWDLNRAHQARAIAEYRMYRSVRTAERAGAMLLARWLPAPVPEMTDWFDRESLRHLRIAARAIDHALETTDSPNFARSGAGIYFELAKRYILPHRRNTGLTYQALLRCWDLFPDVEGNAKTLEILEPMRRTFEAERARLERWAAAAPSNPTPRIELAVHFAHFGYFGDAERRFEALLRNPITRDDPRVLFESARDCWQLRGTPEGYRKAAEIYERLLELAPEIRAPFEDEARRQLHRCRAELAAERPG